MAIQQAVMALPKNLCKLVLKEKFGKHGEAQQSMLLIYLEEETSAARMRDSQKKTCAVKVNPSIMIQKKRCYVVT